MAKPLDDSQLLRLASDLRLRLFPPVRGGAAFAPLIILAGLVPALTAVRGPELVDAEAGWGLRALDVVAASQIQEWLEPGRQGLGKGYLHQPPLQSWLQAAVVSAFGIHHLPAWQALSLLLICLAVWATFLLGRRVGGAAFGMLAALLICGHPILLKIGVGISPAPLGLLLIVVTAWGFLGHLEGPPQLVSIRMLAGAVAWGLALLTIGPVAVALSIPLTVHAWQLRGGRQDSATATGQRLWHFWMGMRTLVVFIVTALSFSGWWQLMMLANYGGEFWQSWWTGQIVAVDPQAVPQSCWRHWLSQNSLLAGWMVVGLVSVVKELRYPSTEVVRRRCQFVLAWWLTALALRIVFDIPRLRLSAQSDAWDVMLLLPTVLLATWGIKAVVLRQASLAVESLLMVGTIGLCAWRVTGSVMAGGIAFLASLTVVALLPILTPRLRGGGRRWTERDWRRLFRAGVASILVGQVVAGLIEFPPISRESQSLTELRRRVATLPAVSRVTLSMPIPESVQFVLRCQWPKATFVSLGTSRPGRDFDELPADELVIEWTRYQSRSVGELPTDRRSVEVGDPIRFRGRRLILSRIGTDLK